MQCIIKKDNNKDHWNRFTEDAKSGNINRINLWYLRPGSLTLMTPKGTRPYGAFEICRIMGDPIEQIIHIIKVNEDEAEVLTETYK